MTSEELDARTLAYEEQQKRIDLRFDLLIRCTTTVKEGHEKPYAGELFGYPPPPQPHEADPEEMSAEEMRAYFEGMKQKFQNPR